MFSIYVSYLICCGNANLNSIISLAFSQWYSDNSAQSKQCQWRGTEDKEWSRARVCFETWDRTQRA